MSLVKEEARKLVDLLPEEATWEDIMYSMYVKKKIIHAIQADDEGKTISHEEIKKKYFAKIKK